MLSAAFMKILEARPRDYDRRMDQASRGVVRTLKEAVAALVEAEDEVLELGCGTGELAFMMVRGGARVVGLDRSEAMVAEARRRIEAEEGLEGRFEVRHVAVEAMDELPAESFDSVVATLVLSELSEEERRYALSHGARVLRPGGRFVIADEVVPRTTGRRLLRAALRLPATAATYLVAGSRSRPLEDIGGELSAAGLAVDGEERFAGGTMALVSAHKGEEESP